MSCAARANRPCTHYSGMGEGLTSHATRERRGKNFKAAQLKLAATDARAFGCRYCARETLRAEAKAVAEPPHSKSSCRSVDEGEERVTGSENFSAPSS